MNTHVFIELILIISIQMEKSLDEQFQQKIDEEIKIVKNTLKLLIYIIQLYERIKELENK
jgi:hypothetical protein